MKSWVAINAQGRVIGRYGSEAEALMATSSLIHVIVEYRPRAKNVKKAFPYL